MIGHAPDPELLYGIDEAMIFFPREWETNASKARYRGWRELHHVDMVDCPFDPLLTSAHVRWAYRITDDPWAELTHRVTREPGYPGAYRVWLITIEEC